MDMPQLWILMDNSFRVTHRPHNCLDNAKTALPTYPQPRLPLFLFFLKEKSIKKQRYHNTIQLPYISRQLMLHFPK
jgi:hypothetical protein